MSRIDGQLNDHFDEMTCLLYLDGQLDSALARDLVSHTAACADCRRLLGSLERETHLLHESLGEEDEAIPARLLAPGCIDNISWARLGAFGLAAAGLYGLWSAVAEPWVNQFRQVGLGQDSLLTMLFFGGVFWKGWSDMLNMMEVMSMGTIAMLVVLLLRRNLRRLISLPVVFVALLLAGVALPRQASAAEFHHNSTESYTLPAGAVVHTDLIVGARSARIDGTVEGDLVVGAGTVTISGHVTGDVIAWGQAIRINGTVDGSCVCAAKTVQISGQVGGSVRALAQVLLIEGSVEKNLMVLAGVAEISARGKVGGSVLAAVASLLSDGRIEHDMAAGFDENELNGYVGGNVNLSGGHLTIGPQAEIHGSASYRGRYRPQVSAQAKLTSPLAIAMQSRWEKYSHPRYYLGHVVRLAAAFVLGLVFLFATPGFFSGAVQKSNRIGTSIGFGAVALVATPILALIACITLVGIPVGILSLLLYVVALYSTQIVVGAWLGEKLLGPGASPGARVAGLALGLVLLRACFVVPVVNAVVVSLMIPMGLGAVVLTAHERIFSASGGASARLV